LLKKASDWERDWKSFREKKPYSAYTKSQAILFLILGLLATGLPYLSSALIHTCLNVTTPLLASSAIGVIYLVLVGGMGFRDWWYDEKKIERCWNQVLQEETQGSQSHNEVTMGSDRD
jgi:hypothetical protein